MFLFIDILGFWGFVINFSIKSFLKEYFSHVINILFIKNHLDFQLFLKFHHEK